MKNVSSHIVYSLMGVGTATDIVPIIDQLKTDSNFKGLSVRHSR